MFAKKGCIILILLVLPFIFADSNSPDWYQIRVQYADGTTVTGFDWTDVMCDTNTTPDANDNSSGYTCDINIGTESAPAGCSLEGNIQYGWRYRHESDPGAQFDLHCHPPGQCTGTYRTIPAVVTYKNAYNIDWDDDQVDCECYLGNSPSYWTVGDTGPSPDNCHYDNPGGPQPNDQSCCCGDDPGFEWYYHESDSTTITINDSVDSVACCDNISSCVDDGGCYLNTELHDVGEPNERGLPQSNDREMCDNRHWHDADEDQSHCDRAEYPTGHPYGPGNLLGDCTFQPGGTCWMQEGETVTFGGFTSADTIRETSCCGDDIDEYYITTNTKNDACCNAIDDFVYANHFCGDVADERHVYGYITGEQPDGSYVPLNNIKVELFFENFTLVNYNHSNALGFYNITGLGTVPGISTGKFYLAVSAGHLGYESPTVFIDLNPGDLYLNFTLNLTSNCRQDCTRLENGEFRCDKNCQGENGCNYNASVTSDIFGGLTMQELCDGKRDTWPVRHNATHNIMCCNKGYIPRFNATAKIEPNKNVRNAQTFYAGTVNYEEDGQFYGVYLIVYTTDQWQG